MREEEKKEKKVGKLKLQRNLRKRWVFPAIYLVSAAVILTGVLYLQGGKDDDKNSSKEAKNHGANYSGVDRDQEAVPVALTNENLKMPVQDEKSVKVTKKFYKHDASEKEQQAALVFYNNTYYPSTGIDIAMEGDESFDVTAALSGTVIKAQKDPILGNIVTLKHEKGITTHYQSLENFAVEAGQNVDQGMVISSAGRNVYQKDAGVHLHFEIRNNDKPIDPMTYMNKSLSSIIDDQAKKQEQKVSKDDEKASSLSTEETEASTEESATDDEVSTESDETNTTDQKDKADENSAEKKQADENKSA